MNQGSYLLPDHTSTIANVLKMPRKPRGLQMDYWGNLLPYGSVLNWKKSNLYNNTRKNTSLEKWKLNKP